MPPSAREYRELMQECLRWAASARSEKERKIFLQIAETWHQAALQIERSLGLVAESRDLLDKAKK